VSCRSVFLGDGRTLQQLSNFQQIFGCRERVSERTELLEASSFKKDVDTQKAVEAAVKASTGGDASLSVAGGDPRPKPPKQEQPGPDSSEQESHKSTIDALIESIELDYEDVVEPNDKDAADAWERERDEMAKQGEGIAAASDSTSAPTKVGAVKTPSVKKSIFPADMSFVDAIATCTTLECLRDAHLQPKGQAKFNFPHFMIIGFQKAATTSLYGCVLG